MKTTWQKWLYLGLRLGFGILLIAASVDKIRYPFEFAQMVSNYRVIGDGLSRWVAVWLPYMELLIGLFLIIGIWIDAAVIINALLMVVFLVLVMQAFIRNLDISCGCFSVKEGTKIGIKKIFENLNFGFFSIFLIWLTYRKNK